MNDAHLRCFWPYFACLWSISIWFIGLPFFNKIGEK